MSNTINTVNTINVIPVLIILLHLFLNIYKFFYIKPKVIITIKRLVIDFCWPFGYGIFSFWLEVPKDTYTMVLNVFFVMLQISFTRIFLQELFIYFEFMSPSNVVLLQMELEKSELENEELREHLKERKKALGIEDIPDEVLDDIIKKGKIQALLKEHNKESNKGHKKE